MAVNAWAALEMATVNGGKALGRKTGRIEKGYDADLILLDAEAVNLIPCHDAANNLAYAAHGSNVVMNMARGKIIYKDGTFFTLDWSGSRPRWRPMPCPCSLGTAPALPTGGIDF